MTTQACAVCSFAVPIDVADGKPAPTVRCPRCETVTAVHPNNLRRAARESREREAPKWRWPRILQK